MTETSASTAMAEIRHAAVIEAFSAIRRNTLRGFAKVRLASGMILNDTAIHQSGDNAWASPASKPMISRDGEVMRDEQNKIRYVPIIEFASKELRDRFSRAVVAAIRETHPGALDVE